MWKLCKSAHQNFLKMQLLYKAKMDETGSALIIACKTNMQARTCQERGQNITNEFPLCNIKAVAHFHLKYFPQSLTFGLPQLCSLHRLLHLVHLASHNRPCPCGHPALGPSTPAQDNLGRSITFHQTLREDMETVCPSLLFSHMQHFSSSKAEVGLANALSPSHQEEVCLTITLRHT